KTTVMQQQSYEGPRLAKPARILVYDFAAHASDLPPGYATAVAAPPADQSSDDLSLGRELGALVAKTLVGELQKMGLPAVRPNGDPPPQPNDIAIVGYFVSVDSGSVAKRFAIGFGSGTPALATVVEVYVMSDRGLRRLSSEELNSTGPKGPGEALPLAVAVGRHHPLRLLASTAATVTWG